MRSGWVVFEAGLFIVSGILLAAIPSLSPLAVLMVLAMGFRPWRRAWRGAWGTGLRGALVWAAAVLCLGMAAQLAALAQPLETGRSGQGTLTYLMVLATLAALVSVLNARNPGGGAWAILMVLLVVVFLIPWLEGSGRLRRAQGVGLLYLDSPWTLFYGLLVVTGVTNFLPTRYGKAALCLGCALGLEYLGLTRLDWRPGLRASCWTGVGWLVALSVWLADRSARRPLTGRNDMERLWLWFRDHWGVVWALRIQDRYNRSAEHAGWPIRLSWYGLVDVRSGTPEVAGALPPEAEATLPGLIRRFATPERLDAVVRPHGGDLATRAMPGEDEGNPSRFG